MLTGFSPSFEKAFFFLSFFSPSNIFPPGVGLNAVPKFQALGAVSEPQNNFYTRLFLCYKLNQAGSRLIWRPRSSSWLFGS